jgi:hypothetical protein
MQSASECNAVARCYIECLRYIVMLHLSESDFCQALVQHHVCMICVCAHDCAVCLSRFSNTYVNSK